MRIALHTILITLLSVSRISICHAQVYKLDSVKIESQGFNTESFVDVSCEAFDNTFKKTKTIKVFLNAQDLSQFKLLTKDFKKAKNQSPDVRGKIVYSYGAHVIKYCFDVFGYFYKDEKRYYNKNLLIYLSDKIYGNHPKYLDTLRQQ